MRPWRARRPDSGGLPYFGPDEAEACRRWLILLGEATHSVGGVLRTAIMRTANSEEDTKISPDVAAPSPYEAGPVEAKVWPPFYGWPLIKWEAFSERRSCVQPYQKKPENLSRCCCTSPKCEMPHNVGPVEAEGCSCWPPCHGWPLIMWEAFSERRSYVQPYQKKPENLSRCCCTSPCEAGPVEAKSWVIVLTWADGKAQVAVRRTPPTLPSRLTAWNCASRIASAMACGYEGNLAPAAAGHHDVGGHL